MKRYFQASQGCSFFGTSLNGLDDSLVLQPGDLCTVTDTISGKTDIQKWGGAFVRVDRSKFETAWAEKCLVPVPNPPLPMRSVEKAHGADRISTMLLDRPSLLFRVLQNFRDLRLAGPWEDTGQNWRRRDALTGNILVCISNVNDRWHIIFPAVPNLGVCTNITGLDACQVYSDVRLRGEGYILCG